MVICRICGNDTDNESFTAYEKLFRTMEEFVYFTCNKCGTLQILHVPEDLSKYYSEGYYSISDINKSYIKSYLKSKWYAQCLGNKNIIGSYIKKKKDCPDFISWLSKIKISSDSAILDVGSGSGIFRGRQGFGFDCLLYVTGAAESGESDRGSPAAVAASRARNRIRAAALSAARPFNHQLIELRHRNCRCKALAAI